MVVAAISLMVLTCLAFLLPVPYVTMRPGPAFNTLGDFEGKPMFTFDKDVKTYPTSGSLDFTTVSMTRASTDIPLADAVRAYFDDDVAVVPKSLIYPDNETEKEASNESAAQLTGSKDSSRVAALRAAGFTVTETPVIDSVVKGGAAEGSLRAGDEVTAVDGTKMATSQAVVEAVGAHEPGDTVRMSVTRDGAEKQIDVVTRPAADDPKLPRIGVTLRTSYHYPFAVTNNVDDTIGGSSAGTMFALAIYDKLTPGALTGGKNVAGTGELHADGTVLPIGGVRQKMAGASKAGADIFLVPAANCAEARDGDDFGLTLVKISTLKDAISSLESLAKDDGAKVPSCR